MKPSFALDFRDNAITLLHRTTRGWQQVGSSPLDAADLGEALSYLRSTALGLSPRGLSTKLVIPNDLILYTAVHAPGPDVAKRRRQIKAGLEGLTPYKVDDLIFDWWGTGPEVQVAVVARETLAEAEGFAVEHRFNPVSFVGAPDNGAYLGEPFFGPSALSATLLAEGEKVERDQDPISGLLREFGKPTPEAAPAEAERSAPAPVEPAPELIPASVAASAPAVPTRPEPPAPPPAEPVRTAPAVTEPEAAPAPEKPAAAARQPAPDPLPDFTAAVAPAKSSFDPRRMEVDLVDEAPMAVDVADDLPPMAELPPEPPVKAPPPVTKPADSDVPPSPASAVIAAFASRRTGPDSGTAAAAETRKTPNLGPAPQQRPPVQRPALAKPAAPLPNAKPAAPPPIGNRETVPFPTKTANAKFAAAKPGKAPPLPTALQAKRDRNVVQLPKAAPAGEEAAAQAAKPLVKGATGLDGRPVATRGKPRYLGLILTGLLLLALALVAAWSSFYLSSNETDPDAAPSANAVASASPEAAPPTAAPLAEPTPAAEPTASADSAAPADPATVADAAIPTAEDEALADGQDLAAAPAATPDATLPDATSPDATAADATVPDPAAPGATVPDASATASAAADPTAADPAAQSPAAVATAPKPEPAPGTVVSTEAAQASTQGNDPQDEIFLADADTPPQTSDPLVLPQLVASSDPPPEASAPPPPFGTLYTFDAEGRIQPTPEGIVTPEGVLLIAGKPPVLPPTRPAALTAPLAAVEAAAAPIATDETLVAPVPFPSDPALADKRPKSRPAGLVDPAAATAKQGEALAPDVNSRFASLRPQARPAALTTPITQAAEVAPPDAELTNTAAAASLALNGVQPSSQAMITSKKPAARPSGMDQAVDAAVAAAARLPEPDQQVASAAPEAQAEPEVETAAPSMPNNASVAKQATVKNAIALNRVALLGIFGTASGRYAMIRQPAGGVKKVVVGDRIDGGRIAAITANAVQYQKGGQMVTLSLPTG